MCKIIEQIHIEKKHEQYRIQKINNINTLIQ